MIADHFDNTSLTGTHQKKYILIDGHSFVYRAFFATPHLSNARGVPTNATYAFLTMIKKLKNDENPDFLAVIFDSKAPSFREAISATYKAQRPPMPPAMSVQFPHIKSLMEAMGIPVVEKEGFEADDIIATMVGHLRNDDNQSLVYIVTGDKDMAQLVGGNVYIYDAQKQIVLGEKEVVEKFGIPPAAMRDFLALAGDTSDNIPGVPGIGAKTARDLVAAFGSLGEIYRRIDEVGKRSVREKLVNGKESAELSVQLATLRDDVPLEEMSVYLAGPGEDRATLRALLRDLEFTKLYREIVVEREEKQQIRETGLEGLRKGKWSLSCLFQGKNSYDMEVAAFAVSDGSGVYFSDRPGDLTGVMARSPDIVMHDYKPLCSFCIREHISFPSQVFDTMLASYLVNPLRKDLTVDGLVEEYLDLSIPPRDLKQAVTERAVHLFDLEETLAGLLNELELFDLFSTIEMPLVSVLSAMEMAGVKVDRRILMSLSRVYDQKLTALMREVYGLAGESFNINSPQQLSRILFDRLGLPRLKKTKTGYSTNTDVLQVLSEQHELPKRILEYRTLAKLKSTYIDVLPTLINQRTGRIHTTYNQMVVSTGRLSSTDPNLQNIPIRGEEGRKIREAFIADDDNLLLSSDYSQIELRVLAHLSQDAVLCETFRRDEDIHSRVAQEVFHVSASDVTHEMRRAAKVINFGIIYGMSGYGLARELGVSQKDAQAYIDDYFRKHEGVRAFMDGIIEDARERGYVRTFSGRIRRSPELASPDSALRQFGERVAMNTPVQGTAADIIKMAMITIASRMKRENLRSRLIMQIHDELVCEVEREEREVMEIVVREEMENVVHLSVPLKVSMGTGENWALSHE